MTKSLYSYVVAFDSGFAPNPFFGMCTLATCKPQIRKTAQIGDWIIGTGSASRKVGRGGKLVHAMQITDSLSTSAYWEDPRFQAKRPRLGASWEQASGDNIYEPRPDGSYRQANSYHSAPDGSQRVDHTDKDTAVPRILVSSNFVYWGGEGPSLPAKFQQGGAFSLVKTGMGYFRKKDAALIAEFETWFASQNDSGFLGEPWDWLQHFKT